MKGKLFYLMLGAALLARPLAAQRVLTLAESKELALRSNAASQNSRLEARAARQTRLSVLPGYFPNISAMGFMFNAEKNLMEMKTQGGNLPVYDGNPAHLFTATQFAYFPSSVMGLLKEGTIGQISAIQPVFAGGRIIAGNQLAALGADAAGLQSSLAGDEVVRKTEELYWQKVALDEKAKTLARYQDMLDTLLRQVEDAHRAGLIMKNDVLKVRLKRNELRLNHSKLDNGRALAGMAFCQYLGIPWDSTLVLRDEMSVDVDPQALYVDKSAALQNRDEYALLKLAVRAEKLQTRLKRGEFLPQAGVGVSGLYMKLDEGEDRTIGILFGTISLPISAWWGGSHQLQERHLREEIAKNNLRDKTELLLLQMEKAWQDLTNAHEQYTLGLEAVEESQENLRINDDSYKNGLITVADLLQAQAQLQQAQDELTEAKANYLLKRTIYLQVTGR